LSYLIKELKTCNLSYLLLFSPIKPKRKDSDSRINKAFKNFLMLHRAKNVYPINNSWKKKLMEKIKDTNLCYIQSY